MEVRHSRRSNDKTKAEQGALIVKLWIDLGKPAVDARLLRTIRSRLAETLENHDVPGPAAIARLLADQGAELKHPEIIETDAEWRARIQASPHELGLQQFASANVLTLTTAEKFVSELEELRERHELNDNRQAIAEIRMIASESRRLAESIARNPLAEQAVRAEQAEIVEWLKVWLQTPGLFRDWLDLRRRTDEFRARFPNSTN